MSKTYTVKGMVCERCISTLTNALESYNLTINEVSLGKVNISFKTDDFNENTLEEILNGLGFSIGTKRNNKIVEQVKSLVKEYFDNFDPLEQKKLFSNILNSELNMSYDNISSIFSLSEKITIEQYIIQYRINIIKHLLETTDLTLTEASFRTGFSSVHHLSKQFKDSTGISPSEYRNAFGLTAKKNTNNRGDNIISRPV